jgi:GDPmannose 4,6-dehydratase
LAPSASSRPSAQPYGAAKVYAYWITENYRESCALFACNRTLFNHESPRRSETFVTRKTTRTVGRIVKGRQECLWLGNLDAKRDWGYAVDYVLSMWQMLQVQEPSDYVLTTGESHAVREFAIKSFACAGIDLVFERSGEDEAGRDAKTGRVLVTVDPSYYRPTEVDLLLGDAGEARKEFRRTPENRFDQFVALMIDADLHLSRRETAMARSAKAQ